VGFLDRISGKNVEEKADQCSEIFSEVLLGLHREFENQDSSINQKGKQIKGIEKKLNDLIKNQKLDEIKKLRILCIISYVFAAGVGVVVQPLFSRSTPLPRPPETVAAQPEI